MTETITKEGRRMEDKTYFYQVWKAANVKKDLLSKGGLVKKFLEFSICQKPLLYLAVYDGRYDHVAFRMRWVKDNFLVLMSERRSNALIDAFSSVLGYNPFCSYCFISYPEELLPYTVEWNKKDCDKRFKELASDSQKKDLQNLS